MTGYLFDLSKSYTLAFLFAGIPPFLGAALMIPVMRRMKRDKANRYILTPGPSMDEDDVMEDGDTTTTNNGTILMVPETGNKSLVVSVIVINGDNKGDNCLKNGSIHSPDPLIDDGYGGDESLNDPSAGHEEDHHQNDVLLINGDNNVNHQNNNNFNHDWLAS